MAWIRNPNYIEGQPIGYLGWWQFSGEVEPVCGETDPDTMKPVEPRLLRIGVDYNGVFRGWVDNLENYSARLRGNLPAEALRGFKG